MARHAALQITAIDHVGIAVPDLEAAIAFHTGVLGGVLAHRERNEEQGVEEAMIAFGGGAQVQLLAPLSPESTIAKFLDRSGPGLQQLAYRVDDVRAAAEPARAAGIRTLYDEPRRGTGGLVDQLPAPQGRRRGAGRAGATAPSTGRARAAQIGVASAESAAPSGTMAP